MKIFCNITFLVFLITIGCAPKSENAQFTDLREKQYEYLPRNQDRELITPASENFDVESLIGAEKAKNQQSPWISNSVGIFRLAENSLRLGNILSGDERTEYKNFGHNILNVFYTSQENSTQFDKTQTMYLPAALGFEGHKIKTLFGTIATPENITKVEQVFETHRITWPDQNPNLKPAEFVRSIKAYLLDIPALFAQSGVSASFVKSFSAQVHKDYVLGLSEGEVRLKDADENSKLKSNAVLIKEVIQSLSFIPQDVIKDLLNSLVKAKNYAEWIEPNNTSGGTHHERLIKVIANIWLDLKPEQREKYIKPANEMLYTSLNDTSDKMLKWFAGIYNLQLSDGEYYVRWMAKGTFIDKLNTSCHASTFSDLTAWLKMTEAQKVEFKKTNPDLFSVFTKYSAQELSEDIITAFSDGEFEKSYTGGPINKFRSDLQTVCVAKIQVLLDKSINRYLLTELDVQIRTWGSLIEKIVREKTMGNLNSIADAIASQEKFTDYFAKLAHPIMNNMLFNDGTLNALENSKVQLFIDEKNQFKTKRQSLDRFDSGAEVLGVSLAAQYRRILGLPEYEQKAATSKEYYRIIFSQVNKMLSMIGFRTIDNKLIPSLHRNFSGDIQELDVYKYECSPQKRDKQAEKKARYENSIRENKKPSPDDFVDLREDCIGFEDYILNMYQIPDQMTLAGAFSPGSYVKHSSVKAQAEIIRGAALMLNYFSDWKGKNDFDLGLGKETYSDISVFPKHAFVNLAVAAMTAPIRGLQRPGSPLKLFNALGEEMHNWVESGALDLEKQNPNASPLEKARAQVLQAAIVDLVVEGNAKDAKASNVVNAENMASYILAIDEFLMATDGIESTQASVINPPDKTIKENMEAIIKGRRLLKMVMYAMSNFLTNRLQDQDGGFWTDYQLAVGETPEGIKKESRKLEIQLSVIKAQLAVYKQWGNESALVSAVEAYYYMNQKLWNPVTSFYKLSESNSTSVIPPYLYLEVVMNYKNIAPHLSNKNSQSQAQRLFDYYSKAFLKWNDL